MKNIVRSICAVVLVMAFAVILLCACTKKKPWDYENVEWYSESPNIQFIKTGDKYWEGSLETKNETFQIQMLWGPTLSFEIIDKARDYASTAVEDITLISGVLKYDDNRVVLIISKDNVFNGEYKQIVLCQREI